MKNLRNLHDKHIAAYVKYRQDQGIAAKTIKNDLGAIRYMHDMLPNVKYQLSNNAVLQKKFKVGLEKTPPIKGNRAWANHEYKNMIEFVKTEIQREGKGLETAKDVQDVMILCRKMGLRITEAAAMTRAQAENAVKTGIYQVKGEAKNGKWRTVAVPRQVHELLKRKMQEVPRGARLFVKETEKVHQTVNRLEKYLYNHRQKIETTKGRELRTWREKGKVTVNPLTFHGLRYGYIQDRVKEEVNGGLTLEKAAARVTREVGHERTKVIKIYLGKNGGEQ